MSKLDTLEPNFRTKIDTLIEKCKEQGISLVCTSGRRTIAEQDKLYAQGRTEAGSIVTNAKGGQSPHNFGLAADFCPTDSKGDLNWNATDDIWHVLAITAVSLGLVAGYNFKSIVDKPHIESSDWKETQALWKAGKLEVA